MKSSRIAWPAVVLVFAFALVPASLADKGGNSNGGGTKGTTSTSHGSGQTSSSGGSCAQSSPTVAVQNTYAWATTGSWGMPGQQVGYQVEITNNDSGCSASTFSLAASAPDGFSVSIPAASVSVNAGASTYVWAYVTSPVGTTDGDYPVNVAVSRPGDSTTTQATFYKAYSTDVTAPTLFWANPWNGQTVSGSSYMVNVSSSDDHAVKRVEFYLDGSFVTSAMCDDVTYICQLSYKLSLRHKGGQHVATFKSYDWVGNVGTMTNAFTVTK